MSPKCIKQRQSRVWLFITIAYFSCSRTLHSVLLICLSFIQYHTALIYCLEVRQYEFFNFVLFQDFFLMFRLFEFPYQFLKKFILLFLRYLFIWLHRVLIAACGISFPNQESNLGPLHWDHGSVIATEPPGNSPHINFRMTLSILQNTTWGDFYWDLIKSTDPFRKSWHLIHIESCHPWIYLFPFF